MPSRAHGLKDQQSRPECDVRVKCTSQFVTHATLHEFMNVAVPYADGIGLELTSSIFEDRGPAITGLAEESGICGTNLEGWQR